MKKIQFISAKNTQRKMCVCGGGNEEGWDPVGEWERQKWVVGKDHPSKADLPSAGVLFLPLQPRRLALRSPLQASCL